MNHSAEITGRCSCGEVRFQLTASPLFVHCCHCRWCQRESGAAFALNAMIETAAVSLTAGKVETHVLPTESGKGQVVSRCPSCRVALWSNFGGGGDIVRFVRVGTLDRPDAWPPDIHIFTQSKQPWVILPAGVPAVEQFYDRKAIWPAASLERWRIMLAAR